MKLRSLRGDGKRARASGAWGTVPQPHPQLISDTQPHDAIRGTSVELTPADERTITTRHGDFAGDLTRDAYLRANQAYCQPVDPGEDLDGENSRAR